jgi:hypothetical protein
MIVEGVRSKVQEMLPGTKDHPDQIDPGSSPPAGRP